MIETANYNDFIILNGGIRYDDYNVSAFKFQGVTGRGLESHNGLVNWNVGGVVKPVPFASVYAAYATSANPVGAEVDGTSTLYGGLSPTSAINQIFSPQRNRAGEVGTKWELFDRRLLVTGALFQTDVDNAREVVGAGAAQQVIAGASYRVQGVDLGVSGKITPRWSIYGGFVQLNSKVLASAVATNVGRRIANVADTSFNVLSKYKITDAWEVGGQATFRSSISGGTLAANSGAVLSDYWRFDAFTEYKITKNLELKLFVNNIFNKLYYDAFYQSASPFVFVAPGPSASLVLSAKY